jgi:hypothetical protein
LPEGRLPRLSVREKIVAVKKYGIMRQNLLFDDTSMHASMGSTLSRAWAKMPHGDDRPSIPSSRRQCHSPVMGLEATPETACHGMAVTVGHNCGEEAKKASMWVGRSAWDFTKWHEKCAKSAMSAFDLETSVKSP